MALRQAWFGGRWASVHSLPAWAGVSIAFLSPNAGWRELKPLTVSEDHARAVFALTVERCTAKWDEQRI